MILNRSCRLIGGNRAKKAELHYFRLNCISTDTLVSIIQYKRYNWFLLAGLCQPSLNSFRILRLTKPDDPWCKVKSA